MGLQLRLLAKFPDSLIARKCGPQVAQEASDRAAQVRLQTGDAAAAARAEFDFWLRSDGHRRNPGTTADLVTAGLFVALWCGLIAPPYRFDGASGHTASPPTEPHISDRQQEH